MRKVSLIAVMLAAALLSSCSAPAHRPVSAIGVEFGPAELIQAPGSVPFPVAVDGNPRVVDSPFGPAAAFDGDGDRLVLTTNPLLGASEFTVEMVFRPGDAFPQNVEPRILHIEGASGPDRRLTLELRLNDRHEWYLDAFIKSDNDRLALIDQTLTHPVGEWFHAAVTYRDSVFTSYVNGRKELEGTVRYLPIQADAQTSIGARLNRVYWFAGDIALVRITPRVLQPNEFRQIRKLAGSVGSNGRGARYLPLTAP